MTDEGPDSRADELQAYSFLAVFANDDRIEQAELEMIERLALKDRVVDADEREVLRLIFQRVVEADVEPAVWQEIRDFRAKFGI